MKLWGAIFAAGYDHFMAASERAGLSAFREALLASATGRVLEIGGGTGANLPYYAAASTAELVVAEPEEPMARRLERRVAGHPIPTRVVRAPAENLPFESATFDTVVSTLVLCTVTDPDRSLAQVRRVLKPGGRLLFMEHVRSEDPRVARWQDRLRRPWAWLGHGCQCNRPTPAFMRNAGFAVAEVRQVDFPKAPPIVRPLVIGTATAPP